MKKRILTLFFVAAMAVSSLAGCNGGEEQDQVKEPTYTISETGYESISCLNDKYLVVMQNDKYGVIDLEGNVVFDFEWDAWSRFADGYFALGKRPGVNSMHGVLFDPNGNEVFNNDAYPNTYIDTYNEGILQLTSYNKNDMGGFDSIYLDGNNDFAYLFTINDEIALRHTNSSGCNNGMITIQNYTYSNDRFKIYINISDTEASYGPERWIPFPYAVSDEGYLNGLLHDETYSNEQMTVYNYKTDRLYVLPSEIVSTNNISSAGNMYVTVANGGYMKVRKDSAGAMAIYSLEDESFITDYLYSYIELEHVGEKNYYLVANADRTKWSFLNTDFEEIGTWYDDASSFNDGYAIVLEDGKLYVIDEDFEKVFDEGIEGESSSALDSIPGAFIIQKGDLYYLLQITNE